MTGYGYDHIILTEDEFPSSTHTWPRKDIDVVRDIAAAIGTFVDSRTVSIMNKGYSINYPAGYSMRETLENIAAMYGGSFITSDVGEVLLVRMFGIPNIVTKRSSPVSDIINDPAYIAAMFSSVSRME